MRPPVLIAAALALALASGACRDAEEGRRAGGTGGPSTSSAEDGGAAAAGSTTVQPPTTTLPEAAVEVVLRGDGLGVVELGAPPEAAVDALTEALGAPTRDTGWDPAFSEYGTCPGEQIRGVEWDHLVLLFTDGATELGEGEHLFAWRVTGAPPALGTATGFGFGATAADAEELYPGQVEQVPAEEPFPAFLVVEAEGGAITAYLDEDDVVTNLEAGVPCGE
ncbi:MAG: hypothetical protein ACLGI8_04085 [Acidimicrobiia bacterium]|jgi:hypothetical protein